MASKTQPKSQIGLKKRFTLIIPNIRSAHNVGSLFRTADGAGVTDIILCGYSPLPLDKFGRLSKPQKEIAKTALGAEQVIPYTYEENLKKAVLSLQKQSAIKNSVLIIGLEQDEKSLKIFEKTDQANQTDQKKFKEILKKYEHIVLIVGEEVSGLTKADKALTDILIELPMRGQKESLNVSVAGGIALYAIATLI